MFWYIIIFLIIILSIIGFVIIRDLLFLIDYLNSQKEIRYRKRAYKKYNEDKLRLKEEQMRREKEDREKYGLHQLDDQAQYEEYIVAIEKPVGKHSEQEFTKNMPKYERIVKTMKSLQEKGIMEKTYWRIITGAAHKIIGSDIAKVSEQEQMKSEQANRSQGKGRGRSM